jgi:D-lactate dehydrogenase
LDVYEHEKAIFFENHQDSIVTDQLFNNLRKLPNVLITGHQAFLTSEALQNIAETTLDNLVNWSKTGATKNELKDS